MLWGPVPTVMRINNWRMAIYTADHLPPHVHVIGPGWVVVVNLRPVVIREFQGCTERQAITVRAAVAENRLELIAKWKTVHG